jgi:hypothetical protein
MTLQRYKELREAGPTITTADFELLKSFRPTLNRLVMFVHLALRREFS